jgi:hypothetical protein
MEQPISFPHIIPDCDGSSNLIIDLYSEGRAGDNYVSILNDTTQQSLCCDYDKIEQLIAVLKKAKNDLAYFKDLL